MALPDWTVIPERRNLSGDHDATSHDPRSRASALFAATRSASRPTATPDHEAIARYRRVAARVSPVASRLCQRETADRPGFDCNVQIGIDTKMPVRNAYFTYADPAARRGPQIRVTVPMLRDIQNDDELAFILGHEYGHLIGRHIEKQQQQQLAGMLIMGTLAAAATAGDLYTDPALISDSMAAGAVIGQTAYSQTYELESDTLGTLIARSAGYDPVRGAAYFARVEASRTQSGAFSFWGTHPPDMKRVATVMATVNQIETQNGIARKASR
jgi:Zn-dependent protease with chaperone function